MFALMNDSLALVWPTLGLMSPRSQNLHANKLPVDQVEHESFYPLVWQGEEGVFCYDKSKRFPDLM